MEKVRVRAKVRAKVRTKAGFGITVKGRGIRVNTLRYTEEHSEVNRLRFKVNTNNRELRSV